MLEKANQLLLKRIIDTFIIFMASPIILILFASTYILVWIGIGRPVLFFQTRPGLHGHPFKLIKFRTMSNECDAKGKLLPDSKRLGKFGIFLRKTSLDELPEIWNILKGEMSFVGPRPLLMKYLDRYSEEQMKRHDVRPGLTGLAQVSGRNSLEWADKFKLDCFYAENHSLKLDVQIILKTILVVIKPTDISKEGNATMPEFKGNLEE